MRIALVADWLTVFGGAEHTIAEFLTIWPEAPLFTAVARQGALGPLDRAQIHTSTLQPVYNVLRRHQWLFPWMPRAIESLDLQGYDVILSSSHAVAKGVIPPSRTIHMCYCHTPMRYAWEMEEEYLDAFGIPQLLRSIIKRSLKKARRWDLSTAKRVDVFLANSLETQRRIQRIYGRESTVIYPPVHDRFFKTPLLHCTERSYYLAIGRLVPYKRFDLAVALANARKLPLKIVGTGQEHARLKTLAGPTVEFIGHARDEELPRLYAGARALLFPQHEDAGIVPLEAQACGTPVIAYDKGGARETIVRDETGVFFRGQSIESLAEALDHSTHISFDPETLRLHARIFSSERFREQIQRVVEETWSRYHMRDAETRSTVA